MRPSIPLPSEMPGPKVYSVWWGSPETIRQKGVYQYTLSPYQAKAAPRMIRNYLFNGYRRLGSELIFWLVPFAIGYTTYTWAKKQDAYYKSKAAHIAGVGH